MRSTSTVAVAALALAGGSAHASLFTIASGRLQATSTIVGIQSVNNFLSVPPPGPGSNVANLGGLVTSTEGYSYNEAPGYSKLNLTLSHHCAYPLGWNQAFTYSDVAFTAPAGTPFAMTGEFSVSAGEANADLHFDVSLFASPGGFLFRHTTVRTVNAGSSIILGVPVAGDTLSGSPFGTVVAGTTYTIGFTIYTDNHTSSGPQMNSTGFVSMALGTVPSPGGLGVLGIGAIVAIRRRRS